MQTNYLKVTPFLSYTSPVNIYNKNNLSDVGIHFKSNITIISTILSDTRKKNHLHILTQIIHAYGVFFIEALFFANSIHIKHTLVYHLLRVIWTNKSIHSFTESRLSSLSTKYSLILKSLPHNITVFARSILFIFYSSFSVKLCPLHNSKL